MPSDQDKRPPGLVARRNSDGTLRWYWEVGKPARQRGFQPRYMRLTAPDGAPLDMAVPAHRSHAVTVCAAMQEQAQAFMAGRFGEIRDDGTLKALLDKYEKDPDSPFHELKDKTQRDYAKDLKRLRVGGGRRLRAEMTRSDFKRWYDAALKPKQEGGPERLRSARGLMVMLRIVMGYGAAEGWPHCKRLRRILGDKREGGGMRFKHPKPRKLRPTYEQARGVFDEARDDGCVSVAIGTALQFEGMLRQYDVTGIWEPLEPGEQAAIVLNNRRWGSGITWGDIGADNVLRWDTPKKDRYVELDLSLYPMVMEALALVPAEKRVGPVIIDERSGLPYSEGGYMKRWRHYADAAGLPRAIWNRDFRAGGVTEGEDAGAEMSDISKHAAHSDPAFTARVYGRGHLEAARRVATVRVKSRGQKNAP